MGRMLSPILREIAENYVAFHCPGCGFSHQIPIGSAKGAWVATGTPEKPTFRPSILARGVRPDLSAEEEEQYLSEFPEPGDREAVLNSRFAYRCHSWVTDGKITFLGDCTHHLANQTVEIPAWPSSSN